MEIESKSNRVVLTPAPHLLLAAQHQHRHRHRPLALLPHHRLHRQISVIDHHTDTTRDHAHTVL